VIEIPIVRYMDMDGFSKPSHAVRKLCVNIAFFELIRRGREGERENVSRGRDREQVARQNIKGKVRAVQFRGDEKVIGLPIFHYSPQRSVELEEVDDFLSPGPTKGLLYCQSQPDQIYLQETCWTLAKNQKITRAISQI
jgi:hypothetical protein